MSQSLCPSCHTHACMNLPPLRLMAFGGAAPRATTVVACGFVLSTERHPPPFFLSSLQQELTSGCRQGTEDLCCSGLHPLEKGVLGGDLVHMLLTGASSCKQQNSIKEGAF